MVLSLGDVDILDEWLRELAVVVTSRLTGNELLLPPDLPPEAMVWADRIVHEVERCRVEKDPKSSNMFISILAYQILRFI